MDLPTVLLLIAGIAFFGFIAFMSFSRLGRGKMLGGRIIWSGEEHLLETSKFSKFKSFIQIHSVRNVSPDKEPKIGIELRSRSAMHFETRPVSLTIEQAQKLADEIHDAIRHIDT